MLNEEQLSKDVTGLVDIISNEINSVPAANVVILTANHPTPQLVTGFEMVVARVSQKLGKSLKARVEPENDNFKEGAIHLAFEAGPDDHVTLADLFGAGKGGK